MVREWGGWVGIHVGRKETGEKEKGDMSNPFCHLVLFVYTVCQLEVWGGKGRREEGGRDEVVCG